MNNDTNTSANEKPVQPQFEVACEGMSYEEVLALASGDGYIGSVATTEDRECVPCGRLQSPSRKTFPPRPMPSDIPLDGLEREYLEEHPPYPKLIKKFPHLKGLSVSKWYSAIPHDFAANNPRLMQTLFNISEEAQTDIKDTLQLCPSMRDEMHRELAEYDHLAHAAEVGSLPQIAGLPQAVFEDTTTQGGGSTDYRKYPKDTEALALLGAASKLKEKLAKKNPNITNKGVIQALLDDPDGNETKKQKAQRLKHQYRVWYGSLKNGKRKNATTTPPNHLDAQTRNKRWSKIFSQWAKYLSEYENHPPAE